MFIYEIYAEFLEIHWDDKLLKERGDIAGIPHVAGFEVIAQISSFLKRQVSITMLFYRQAEDIEKTRDDWKITENLWPSALILLLLKIFWYFFRRPDWPLTSVDCLSPS